MKKKLEELLRGAVDSLKQQGIVDQATEPPVQVTRCKDSSHGDFASNLAMILAKPARKKPRDLAELIVEAIPESPVLAKIEIAGPGFINFFIDPASQFSIIPRIHEQNSAFGLSRIGAGKKVQVEFVSANPTGPLHVGHGRGAAYGSAVASLLQAAGFEVHREYYVNDAGRQMDILATSIWLRYLERCGEIIPFPNNAYRGNYIREISRTIYHEVGERYRRSAPEVMAEIPPDEVDGGDKETHIDAMIERCRSLLGAEGFNTFLQYGLDDILSDIRADLEEFGVYHDEWFSERRLTDNGAVEKALEKLRASELLYEKDGATWFACTRLGDEKDRVVVRENGQTTYLASDIAYHLNKIERGYDVLIDVWGADHHGYVPRVKAAIEALGKNPSLLEVLLVQFAVLYRGKEKVSMSTRSGEFVTLRELRNEVGKDAARFFYLMRRCEQHMDFDLDLARSESKENPVYYVQYAHARICSVFRKLDENNWNYDPNLGMSNLMLLNEQKEQELLAMLARYPEVIETAAQKYEPHLVIQYLRDLATDYHKYNDTHKFLVEQAELRNARLNLVAAIRQVIANGLNLMGISAPEAM